MLRSMRKQASSWIIRILLGVIVLAFIFMGVGSYRNQRANRVAMVNDQPISIQEFQDAYNQSMEQLRRQFGDQLTDDMIKMFQVKKRAMDQLINAKLMEQEAEKLGIQVTDEELTDTITQFQGFQANGRFNRRQYERVLNRIHLTPEIFEYRQRNAMLANKVRSLIDGSVKVSDAEAFDWFQWRDAEMDVDFVTFEPGTYKDIDPSEADIKAYYDQHQSNYQTEARIKVRYVQLNPKSYEKQISLSDEAIKQYYDNNPSEFFEPATVEARHILLKVDPDADPEIVESVRNRALAIMEKARDGKQSFADLAKEYSEGPTKDKGGYLGEFKRDAMVKPFSDAAFAMKPGEISEPVKTRFGWHIIKVEKVNKAKTLTLEEATPQIRAKLIADKSKGMAYDEAETVFDSCLEDGDLGRVAKAHDLKLTVTDFFSKKKPAGGMADPSQFTEAAFNLRDKDISDILEMKDGYFIMQAVERKPQETAAFEDVKNKVKADLVKELQDTKASESAQKFLADVRQKNSLEEAAQAEGKTVMTTGFFKRNAQIPNIGYERSLSDAAFKLSDKNRWPETPIKGRKGYYVLQFKERRLPDKTAFADEKDTVFKTLYQQKEQELFSNWLANLRENSEITVEEAYR